MTALTVSARSSTVVWLTFHKRRRKTFRVKNFSILIAARHREIPPNIGSFSRLKTTISIKLLALVYAAETALASKPYGRSLAIRTCVHFWVWVG
jgi:hypothetical protein